MNTKAKVTVKGLNLRMAPNAGAKIVTILKKGQELDLYGIDTDGWTKVSYGIMSGFVASRFIETFPEPVPHILTLSERALNIALSQLGNEEKPRGSNWGPAVEKYLKSVGITTPSPWCLGFVYWCVSEATKEMGVPNPLTKTGHVLTQWRTIDNTHKFKTPEKGDIFIMDFGGGKGHTGFVTSVANGRIQTIEGNSSDSGSREGFEVCRKPGGRNVGSCIGYIRI